MKSFIFLLLISTYISAGELLIAVASNMQFAMKELKKEFELQNNIKLQTVFNSSGKLTAQIQNGAPFDLFLSADMKYPTALYQAGLTIDSPQIYACGSLVLWSMKKNNLFKRSDSTAIKILLNQQIVQIAIANPRNAPYGRAAIEVLKYYQYYHSVSEKLVYGQNISQTTQYIFSRVVEIGFIAKSVVFANIKK